MAAANGGGNAQWSGSIFNGGNSGGGGGADAGTGEGARGTSGANNGAGPLRVLALDSGELVENNDWLSEEEVRQIRNTATATGTRRAKARRSGTQTASAEDEDDSLLSKKNLEKGRELLVFGGLAFVLPAFLSIAARFAVFEPILERRAEVDIDAFGLSIRQKRNCVDRLLREEKARQFDVLIGRAPAVPESPERLKEELMELEHEEREKNIETVGNVLSDITFFSASSAFLLANRQRARTVIKSINNRFFDLEPATQAFCMLLVADITVGYHSADGWIVIVENVCEHYGFEPGHSFVNIFVAVVPVSIDVCFKYWVFKYLRQLSPSTGIILEDIDRH